MTTLSTSDHKDGDEPGDLDGKLTPDAPPFGEANSAKRGIGENRGEQHANGAAHAMHGEHIERIVDVEAPLHQADHDVADRAAGKPDDERAAGPTKPDAGVTVARPATAR